MTNESLSSQDDTGPVIDHDPNEKPQAPRVKRKLSLTVGIALAAVIGIGAVVAVAQGGGWKGGMGHMGAHFAEHRVGVMLDEIDASAEQETKIWAIIDRTRSELRPMGREFRQTREEVATLLAAPTIDKAAVEKLRAERIAAIDEASKKAVAAVVEAAEVLTPEQRTKLVEEMKERHGGRW
jgi:Spy/CpxP family protein refolding chaperone